MTLLQEFAARWEFQIKGSRIDGVYGYVEEQDGKLWVWTHSHAPHGHEFFAIERFDYDELRAVVLMRGQ
jgi:hypothetical protein